jgi:3'(2'), 5'-bisphosphate nucleotidase
MDIVQHINLALKAAVIAGKKIMTIYNSNEFEIELKQDKSPLTKADKISHLVISEILKDSKLPILSEEGKDIAYSKRKSWKLFWLVDPIDGTKEFISRNGEFTVNIALIRNNKPVAGVIFVPVSKELYVGIVGHGSYEIKTQSSEISFSDVKIQGYKLPNTRNRKDYVIIGSRSFMNEETETFIDELKKEYPGAQILCCGSSLKICMVAEGKANIYPRFGPTMEWDTAAGHAIVKAVGQNICRVDEGIELTYNKEDLLNPFFIVR